MLIVAKAFREGLTVEEVYAACHIDPWFLREIQAIVAAERTVRESGLPDDALALLRLKKLGFSDTRLAALAGMTEGEVAARRGDLGVAPVYKRIDTCAAEFPSLTPYMYSCYEGDGAGPGESKSDVTEARKVVILGEIGRAHV